MNIAQFLEQRGHQQGLEQGLQQGLEQENNWLRNVLPVRCWKTA